MVLGVSIALFGTGGARTHTGDEQIADGEEVPLSGSRKNPRGGSQMSAQTRLSAMQARSVTTSFSMRSESAHAVQAWTQVKQVSIAAASSATATGTASGEASSIWRVSVMPFRKPPTPTWDNSLSC